MRFVKGLWNFISGLIAVVLSFALVFVLLAIPVMFTVHKATEPEGLHRLLLLMTAKEQPATDPEEILMEELMQTNTAKELLGLYREDLFGQMQGKAPSLDTEALMQITQNNMDELLPILRNLVRQSGLDISGLTDAQLAQLTQQMMAYYGGQLLQNLPSPKQLGIQPIQQITPENIFVVDMELVDRLLTLDFRRDDIPAVITQMVILLNDYLGLKLLGMVAALLSLLIILFRLGQGFRSINWVGSNFLIGGGMGSVLGLYGYISVGQRFMNSKMSPFGDVLQFLLKWFAMSGAVILALGIVLLLLAAGGNALLQKRRKKNLVQ